MIKKKITVPRAAIDKKPIDWVDVTGWGVFLGYPIPVDVAKGIALRINAYHDYRVKHG